MIRLVAWRHAAPVIMGASGLGIGFAAKIPDAGLQVLAQALAGLVMVGTVLYGRWERRRLAALDHAGSLRSAAIGIRRYWSCRTHEDAA